MKHVIQINYIFWKEGPLLPRLLADSTVFVNNIQVRKPEIEYWKF